MQWHLYASSQNKKQAENRLFLQKVGKNSQYFVGIFYETIIPLAPVGYEMIMANSYPMHTHGIIVK